ncbi:Methylenetetrahydrofolate reductase (modular protein) [Desulfarculales bacterium]
MELESAPSFSVCSTLNTGALGTVPQKLADLGNKTLAGAELFVTSPVFNLTKLADFAKHVQGQQARIISNILLLKSVSIARAIDMHLKHMHIPGQVIEHLKMHQTACANAWPSRWSLSKASRSMATAG